jgi:quinol monooxygenase YgiN
VILVLGTVRCPPENLDALKGPMGDVVAASRAEDGCIEYAYGADMLDPGLIRVVEAWRDRAALEAHFKQPHMHAWRAARALLGVGGRNLSLYESSDPEPI